MVETEQDVLDADDGIGQHDLVGAGTRLNAEGAAAGQNPADLFAAVFTHHAHDGVGACFGQTGNADGLAVQSFRNADPPALDGHVVGEYHARHGQLARAGGEMRRQLQRGAFVKRRQLPHHLIGFGTGLGQLQIGGLEVIGSGPLRKPQQQCRQQSHADTLDHGLSPLMVSPSITIR